MFHKEMIAPVNRISTGNWQIDRQHQELRQPQLLIDLSKRDPFTNPEMLINIQIKSHDKRVK